MAEALNNLCWNAFLSSLHEEAAPRYEGLPKCLQAAFPTDHYTIVVEGTVFKSMIETYAKFIADRKKVHLPFGFHIW